MRGYTNKYHHLKIMVIVMALAGVILFFWPVKSNKHEPDENRYANMGGDFLLQSSEGPVSLSGYKGKVVILYFGYTFCPDVCPTSLGLLSLALNKLTASELENIQALFISVDPERDTLDKLHKYAQAFHPKIKGITGSAEQIAEIARRYGVAYMKVATPGSALGYTVDHSSRYYFVGRDGTLQKLVEHGASPDQIVLQLRQILER